MDTVGDLIEGFGGPAAFGRIIGKGASTASEMKRRGTIQPVYWPSIIEAAPHHGIAHVDADLLMRLHLPPVPGSSGEQEFREQAA